MIESPAKVQIVGDIDDRFYRIFIKKEFTESYMVIGLF